MSQPVSDSPELFSRYVVRVRFGETDLMGIVHHATYLSYCEAGRVEYMHRRGIDYLDWTKRGIHLPVVEANLRYRKMARFDDLLAIDTRLESVSRATVRFAYRIVRYEEGEELIAEGHTLLACVGDNHALRRVPADLADVLKGPETHPRPVDQV